MREGNTYKKITFKNKVCETSLSNLSFEAHCAFNDSNTIDESKIITIKNEYGENIILKTQPLA